LNDLHKHSLHYITKNQLSSCFQISHIDSAFGSFVLRLPLGLRPWTPLGDVTETPGFAPPTSTLLSPPMPLSGVLTNLRTKGGLDYSASERPLADNRHR